MIHAPAFLKDLTVDGLIVNLILAAGTLVLAVYAVKQTRATRIAADAAKVSADILRESQRSHIVLTVSQPPSQTLADQGAPRVVLSLHNKGVLTAHGCLYESWIEVLPLPFTDFSPSADYFKSQEPFSLYAGHLPMVLNLPFRQD